MANITFHNPAASNNEITQSGIGFYGSTFGTSVSVGQYQDLTYVTNSGGTIQGVACNNIKYYCDASGFLNGQVYPNSINLQNLPNVQATIGIRFTHTSDVLVQNVKLRAYNRNNINEMASGTRVTFKMAELCHTGNGQTETSPYSDSNWITPASGGESLRSSPGPSGVNVPSEGAHHTHDWFIAATASPDTVGSKYFALYASLEYL